MSLLRSLKYSENSKEKSFCISSIISDHGIEFKHDDFRSFYENNGIFHNFSSPRTPQQNWVVERKIEHYKKWLGPCFAKTHFLSTYRKK